jgi:agmatine deiminase
VPGVPFSSDYIMPAEWEPHDATWRAWPKNRDTFPGDTLAKVELVYVQMIEALTKGETVNVLVDDADAEERVAGMLRSTKNVSFHIIRTSDVWVRDYGPIFIRGRDIAATKWLFNAWGGKYSDLLPDNDAGTEIARSTGLKVFEAGVVLEGGSIDMNGEGACLTTEECLLNRNRNRGLNRREIEGCLTKYLGARSVIWLKKGIAGDDTDGHVDDIARFVDAKTVVCTLEEDPNDENFPALKANYDLLKGALDQDGRRIEVVTIPMPGQVSSEYGRLPASYANFYIANKVVLVPVYGDRNDDRALDVLGDLFPGRKVQGIECTPLVNGLGAIHCVTQQQPSLRR